MESETNKAVTATPAASSSTVAAMPLAAGSAVVLLSNWESFGLCERSGLHFDWIDALLPAATTTTTSHQQQASQAADALSSGASSPAPFSSAPFCGVSALLECVPKELRLRSDQRRRIKNDVRQFNARAHRARWWGQQDNDRNGAGAVAASSSPPPLPCHVPSGLPLRLSFGTSVVFGYETTRIAFVVDASPTLTGTYGFGDNSNDSSPLGGGICPLDRLVPMARTFFEALVQPVQVQVPIPARGNDPSPTRNVWIPDVAVTVLAVFPRASAAGSSSLLLVRDYRLRDAASASLLLQKLEEWVAGPLEGEIASRLANPAASMSDNVGGGGFGTSSMMPQHTSYLRDLLAAGDVVLSTLSSAAKPVVVLATDARSLAVDAMMVDVAADPDRIDVPLVVLDVSSPESHDTSYGENRGSLPTDLDVRGSQSGKRFHMLSYDPNGPAFPLFLSDDAEALYGICRATGGAYYDAALLNEAARTVTGKVPAESPLLVDHVFSSKRHTLRANAVQWYTLFTLSPLSPVSHPQVGRLPPPEFILRRKRTTEAGTIEPTKERPARGRVTSGVEPSGGDVVSPPKKTQSRFAMYIVNPIRIKGLLFLRLKEGCRVRAYGSSTNDPDKVSIQFVLPLDVGNALHYELSYKALPGHGRLVGFANIKIDLAGEHRFIQAVKKEYLLPGSSTSTALRQRPASHSRSITTALVNFLQWLRAEDQLESHLSPLKWSDQLASPDTPFLKRIGALSDAQRRRHLRRETFDCVCQGRMPYERDDGLLAEFRRDDNGEEELLDAVKAWSTQTISSRVLFLSTVPGEVASYSVVGLSLCLIASRLITVTVDSCGDISPNTRIEVLDSLRRSIDSLSDVGVLTKQLGPSIVVSNSRGSNFKQWLLKSQQRHSSWNLVKDPELLPLLVRRRIEFGGFLLLDSSDRHALLAKLRSRKMKNGVVANEDEDPGVLFQYLLTIKEDGVAVDLHMENEGGDFANLWNISGQSGTSMFEEMVRSLTKRDQDCAQALQSRTRLRRVFEGDVSDYEVAICAKRLLAYASQSTQHLRFFRYGCGTANDTLRELTHKTLVANLFGARVAPLPTSYDFQFDANAAPTFSGIQTDANAASDWFIVEFDSETITIVCLSSADKIVSSESGTSAFRTLDFFTFTTGDVRNTLCASLANIVLSSYLTTPIQLYNRKADVVAGEDDDSDDGHVSEYLCVSEFSDFLLEVHAMNYSSAAYIALASNEHLASSSPRIHSQDFEFVLAPLDFVEVVSVVIPGANDDGGTPRSTFATTIGSLLFPISDDIVDCYYYRGGDSNSRRYPCSDDDVESTSERSHDTSQDEMSAPIGFHQSDSLDRRHSGNDLDSVMARNEVTATQAEAPLFVKLLFDGKPALHHELTRIEQSVSVSVLLSVFRVATQGRSTEMKLPPSHESAKFEISSLLNAFISEQTLERLRTYGPTMQSADLRLAKSCLRNARDVARSTLEAVFYSARVNAMIPAAAPAGYDADVDVGFRMLMGRLLNTADVQFREYGDGLVVVNAERETNHLLYWSFVTVNLSLGMITTEVFHPDGFDQATAVLSKIRDLVSASCHNVNQQLLLERLHQRRLASYLLIARDDEPMEHVVPDADVASFASGFFSCPVVFRTSFDLFHRCATNPSQVARTVEATVLHVFGISNRRQLFVYKDEDGSVFYMRLRAEGGGVDPDGSIELNVHGISEPGPSVTKQLTAIIQKKLLQIGVDMLSSVLIKNPSYTWKPPDVAFIRAYEAYWESLESNDAQRRWDRDRVYEFPDETLFDPGMILLCLRQNLCGSGYFHKLNLGEEAAGEKSDDGSIMLNDFGLIFYYNDAPSKLDPKLQHISTLTSKGAQYAREAGSGMAIIELELLLSTGVPIDRLTIGGSSVRSMTAISPESVCFRRVEEARPTRCCIKVTVTGTALDANVLHEWVLLSLNQTLLSWAIERHLEAIQTNHFAETKSAVVENGKYQDEEVDKLAPGLSYFTSLLKTSHSLPHPSVLKCDLDGVIRSSTVATVACELLEKTIETHRHGLTIVRLSRDEIPRKVDLKWEAHRRSVVAFDVTTGRNDALVIADAPIDCPEYRCFFFTPEYAESEGGDDAAHPKLFESVTLTDGTGADPIPALVHVKNHFPSLFRRSSAFVFSIKRNRRVLLAYNWTPQHFKQVVARLREKNALSLASTNLSINSLQHRCLRGLSPTPVSARPFLRKPSRGILQKSLADDRGHVTTAVTTTESTSVESLVAAKAADATQSVDPQVTGKRAIRPLAIRRPVLVGKSVEGAAAHAVAASRARASANMFRSGAPTGPVLTSTRRSAANEPTSGSSSARQVKLPPERGKSTLSSVSEPGEDEEVKKLKVEYLSLVHPAAKTSLRLHTRLQNFVQSMGPSLTPSDQSAPHSNIYVTFLLSRSFTAWNDLVEIPRLPSERRSSFLQTFARALTTCLPTLNVLSFTASPGSESSHVVIVGETRAVRNCKCLAVVNLELVERRDRLCVRGNSWVATLPRYSNESKRARKWPRYNDQSTFEKDSAGLDVLAFDSHVALSFRTLLFDFVSALAERDATTMSEANDTMDLARGMLSFYNLPSQIRTLQSNYKIYESQIVLRSYRDPLIARFEARELFDWLQSNATDQGLVPCGSHGICLQRKVQCRDTTSTIFLRNDADLTDRFVLMVLCRTQGRDLREFMFPNGAVVGVSVMDFIAIEAAGMIYEHLKTAATQLHLSDLWKRASSGSPQRRSVVSRSPVAATATASVTDVEIRTLLRLCSVTPLVDVLRDPFDVERWNALVNGDEGVTDWRRCTQSMALDPAFSPWWPVALDDDDSYGGSRKTRDGSAALFYLKGEDLFLLVRTCGGGDDDDKSHRLDVSVVQPSKTSHDTEVLLNLAQKLFNYFLHFVWSELM